MRHAPLPHIQVQRLRFGPRAPGAQQLRRARLVHLHLFNLRRSPLCSPALPAASTPSALSTEDLLHPLSQVRRMTVLSSGCLVCPGLAAREAAHRQ